MVFITNPGGVSFRSDGQEMSFEFAPDFGSGFSVKFSASQRTIDSEVLRYGAPYVPFDSGTAAGSGVYNTVIGSGEVKYKTPYARRIYYNPQFKFRGAPMRGAYWFERMKADHKADILRAAGREFR